MSSHIRHYNSLQYYDSGVLHLITVCNEPTPKLHSGYVITINNFIPEKHKAAFKRKRTLILKQGRVNPSWKDMVF